MRIDNLHIIGRKGIPSRIVIDGSRIDRVENYVDKKSDRADERVISFNDALAFPGLINSHDHLEFNLFPKLGNRVYDDYVEWGNDIHALNKKQIDDVQKIPYELRFRWGLYKNLLCGVTTVAHHGNSAVYNYENLPGVILRYNYLHSIRLERHWKLKLNLLSDGDPLVIHIGEGKNPESLKEIGELIKWNLFHKKIIGVHGIALNQNLSPKLKAVVWCPDSNLFLYEKTAGVNSIKTLTKILFGTDSTLSADWNLWNHLRLARKIHHLDDEELYKSVTGTAAEVWNINSIGALAADKTANIVVSKKKYEDDWESFYSSNPEDVLLVLKNGKIVLADKSLADEQPVVDINNFDLISVGSAAKYVTKGIKELIQSVQQHLPGYEFPVKVL